MIIEYDFGRRRKEPCSDCDEIGHCTMNCGPPILMQKKVLELRALAAARGKRGVLVSIGLETRTQQDLVEQGHLWQEIADGRTYRFTLSPSGRKMLDQAEEK